MKSASVLAFSAALVLAAPGLAFAASCERPQAPAAVDGGKASLDELKTAKGAVTTFMSDSDTYQSCVLDDLAAQKAQANAAKSKLDPAVAKAAEEKVSANQADKERVGSDFNAAVKAYKAAHPS
jgi:hypothetical protein